MTFSADGSFTWSATHDLPLNAKNGPSSHLYRSQWIPGEYRDYWNLPECGGTIDYRSRPHRWRGSSGITGNVHTVRGLFMSRASASEA
jgi:hypothetical protein